MSTSTSSPVIHLETSPIRIQVIVAAADLSEDSSMALRHAARYARQFHAHLHVVHAVAPQMYAADTAPMTYALRHMELKLGRERLHDYTTKIPEIRTTKHTETVVCGPPETVIADFVTEKAANIVVLGSHGRDGIAKMVLGSVAERVMRQSACPLLIVGPNCKRRLSPLRSVLLATEAETSDLRAAQYAASIAEQVGAPMSLVRVLPESDRDDSAASAAQHPSAIEGLRQLVSYDPETRGRFDFHVKTGDVPERIAEVAHEVGAELIVIGTRKHWALEDHNPFSIHSELIRIAECPVLVVPWLAAR
ncbi:universal stress protein [Silvibacterium acidisoli]|uniref:universal stress protein n=1 Tax=Acidobacteriaceae bacterium ZG23-2 TaxID=2883246 RepID=UPI00406CB20E